MADDQIIYTQPRGPGGFVGGLQQGFGFGMDAAKAVTKGMANRRVGKLKNELNDYIARAGDDGGIPDIGSEGKKSKTPSTRDLMSIQQDYEKALRLANDPEWEKNSREMWAQDINDGFNQFVAMAQNEWRNGNENRAMELAKRGMALFPNGTQYEFQLDKDGSWVVDGYDEETGEPTEQGKVDPGDLHRFMVQAKSPAESWEMMKGHMDDMQAKRTARANAAFENRKQADVERGTDIKGIVAQTGQQNAANAARKTDIYGQSVANQGEYQRGLLQNAQDEAILKFYDEGSDDAAGGMDSDSMRLMMQAVRKDWESQLTGMTDKEQYMKAQEYGNHIVELASWIALNKGLDQNTAINLAQDMAFNEEDNFNNAIAHIRNNGALTPPTPTTGIPAEE